MSRPSDSPNTERYAKRSPVRCNGVPTCVRVDDARRLERSRNYWKRMALKAEQERDEEQGERVRSSFGLKASIESITLRAGEEFKPRNSTQFTENACRAYWRNRR